MVIANGANGELPAGSDCMNMAQSPKSQHIALHCTGLPLELVVGRLSPSISVAV